MLVWYYGIDFLDLRDICVNSLLATGLLCGSAMVHVVSWRGARLVLGHFFQPVFQPCGHCYVRCGGADGAGSEAGSAAVAVGDDAGDSEGGEGKVMLHGVGKDG